MKIAITGATGHLGSAIVPELCKRNYVVKALVRENEYSFAEMPVDIVHGDLLHRESLEALLLDCDALIHCAAVISINGDPLGIVHQTNVEGTKLVMEIAKQRMVKRVVHISSIHAYNQRPAGETLTEQREKVNNKAFAYDRSKKAGQEIALAMNQPGMEVLVMNPTSIVGPHDHKPSKMGKVIIDLYLGRLPFVFDGGFDFCDCRDVACAVANALTMGRAGENYLLAGKWHSFKQLVQLISKVSHKKINVASLPPVFGKIGLPVIKLMAIINKTEPLYTGEALEAIFGGNRKISSAKAKQELHYSIRPFEETIADTIKWFQQNGYLVR
ncbi:MAG TPA: NAD-dependent epimerase/dehydratase family protein [Puia sp.]|jgi:dihydroflavonol-4-reductase|nr:NAD-dependent epimerase/dehydratase family protein [Puia sp.]